MAKVVLVLAALSVSAVSVDDFSEPEDDLDLVDKLFLIQVTETPLCLGSTSRVGNYLIFAMNTFSFHVIN